MEPTPDDSPYEFLPLSSIFIRDLIIQARIGVHDHERHEPQAVRIAAEVLTRLALPVRDDISHTFCYDQIIGAIRAMATSNHIELIETLAQNIIAVCFSDRRIELVRVTVEKLDAYQEPTVPGVTLTAVRCHPPGCNARH